MTTSQIDPHIYQAAHKTAVLTDRSNLGILKFTGASRLDLIHRMSTQNILNLQAGAGAATILTTDLGRIIDRLILYAAPEQTIALTGENNAEAIARYLMRFIFFNDDIQIEDISEDTAVFAIYGPQAQEKLVGAGFPAADLPLHHWRQAEINGIAATLHRTDPIAGDGYFILCQTAVRQTIWQHLLNTRLPVADEAAYDLLRIENTHPRFGHELTQAYIPLEAGLWDDVSFSKGCYIGQEIIARMESRGKLAKKLIQIQPPHPVTPGTTITANGKTAGSITSAAVGPHGPIALGYVKTAVLDAAVPLLME